MYTEITPTISDSILKHLKSGLANLVSLYSKEDEQDGTLNFRNQNFNEIFDRPGPVYNFMTGRTISYLHRMMEGLVHLGIVRKEYKPIVVNVFLGLVGLGTNTFKDPEHKEDGDFKQFQVKLISRLNGALRRSLEENITTINATEVNYSGKTVERSIADWLRFAESSGGIIYDKNLSRLMTIIKDKYPTDIDGMEKVLMSWDNVKMMNDLQKITTLHNNLKAYSMIELEGDIKTLGIIKEAYAGYLSAARDGIVN
jgi:hypothetical protein